MGNNIKMNVLGNKSLYIEANWFSFSLLSPNPVSVDTFLLRHKIPTIVVNEITYPLMKNIMISRGSNYKMIIEVDRIGRLFSTQKLSNLKSFDLADGFDVTLSKNKNKSELTNEIKSIHSMLQSLVNRRSQKIELRLSLYMQYGSDYVNNCIDAITSSKVDFNMVKFIWADKSPENEKLMLDLSNVIKSKLGKNSFKMKIPYCGNFHENNKNLYYDMSIEEITNIIKSKSEPEIEVEQSESSEPDIKFDDSEESSE